jgi:transcriptional/translational regulatory protein YebC/TACO1
LDYNIVDIIELEDAFEIKTTPHDYYDIKDILTKNNYNIYDSDVKLIAQSTITSISDDTKARLEKFIDSITNDDDLQ